MGPGGGGFEGKSLGGYIFEHGEVVTGRHVENILTDFGLAQRDLARDLGVHHVWLSYLLRTKRNHPLRAVTARLFVNYRRQWNPALVVPTEARASGLERAGAIRGQRRRRWLLRSEFEALPAQYRVLLEVLQQLREGLRTETIKPSKILEWICIHSRAETTEHPEGPMKFRRMLFWWPAFRLFLEQSPGILLRMKPSGVAYRFMAFDHETTDGGIRDAVAGEVKPLEPERAHDLVRLKRLSLAMPVETKAARRGRRPGMLKETRHRIEVAAAFELLGWSKRKMAPHVFPDQPASAETNIYRFYNRYRQSIAAAKQQLTPEHAQDLVQSASNSQLPPKK
jgi:hypothetical protein